MRNKKAAGAGPLTKNAPHVTIEPTKAEESGNKKQAESRW